MKKKKRLLLVTVVLLLLLQCTSIFGEIPYKTYTQDGYGRYVETQTAYEPIGTINKVGELTLEKPADLKISAKGLIYIADTGNKRVIVTDQSGQLIRIIGEGDLSAPMGLFITPDETIYVADEKKGKVFVYSETGELLNTYGKPDHPLFGKSSKFEPQKLVVDDRGTMYILSKANTNGIIQISPSDGGSFLGYFGTNDTRISLLTLFRKAIFTDEQKKRMTKSEPVTIANIAIDDKGLVYTVSQGEKSTTLKKMNIAGKNLIFPKVYDEFPGAVTNGSLDNVFVASKNGFIYEYNSEGTLLFVFGARDDGRQRVGLFKTVSAIALDQSNNLYVLDEEKNEIQIFRETEFAKLVHNALDLYQKGKYLESKEPWEKVLQMNSLFDYAYLGIGEAYYREENYDGAMAAYRVAKSKSGFSDAFWEVRNVWMKKNLIPIMLLIGFFYVLSRVLKFADKKKNILEPMRRFTAWRRKSKLWREITFLTYVIKNPSDAYYGIRHENKTSYKSANILLLIIFGLYLLEKYATGFIFKGIPDGYYDFVTDGYMFFGLILIVMISHYLITSINDGEGRFRDVYQGFVYAFAPYILIKPWVIGLSHVLTWNESFIITFANFLATAGTAILMFLMIKYINDYKVGETIKIILFTLFTVLIALLILFILYVLLSQVVDFAQSLIGEAVYRLGSH